MLDSADPEFAEVRFASDAVAPPRPGGGELPYGNLSGRSGVLSYDLGERETAVLVHFRGGTSATYSEAVHGRAFVQELRDRLVDGAGACTWINQNLPGRGRAAGFDPLTPRQRARLRRRRPAR